MASAMMEDNILSAEDDQLASMSTDDIVRASRLLDNEVRILKEELQRTNLELESYKEKIKENQEKIKLNKQLPYLVGNIVEILEMNPEDEAEEDGANIDLDSQRKGKCVVLKTSTRQTIFLPVVGLVDPDKLKPGDLVGVNKDSYLILDTLPSEYDSRVKAMEVDEKPTEDYNDIGGLEKQIQELVEAIVLPMTHKERFQKLGVRPPKGVLLYGPPGTGKTLMARACAAQTNATFLKLAGPSSCRYTQVQKMVPQVSHVQKMEFLHSRGELCRFRDSIERILILLHFCNMRVFLLSMCTMEKLMAAWHPKLRQRWEPCKALLLQVPKRQTDPMAFLLLKQMVV